MEDFDGWHNNFTAGDSGAGLFHQQASPKPQTAALLGSADGWHSKRPRTTIIQQQQQQISVKTAAAAATAGPAAATPSASAHLQPAAPHPTGPPGQPEHYDTQQQHHLNPAFNHSMYMSRQQLWQQPSSTHLLATSAPPAPAAAAPWIQQGVDSPTSYLARGGMVGVRNTQHHQQHYRNSQQQQQQHDKLWLWDDDDDDEAAADQANDDRVTGDSQQQQQLLQQDWSQQEEDQQQQGQQGQCEIECDGVGEVVSDGGGQEEEEEEGGDEEVQLESADFDLSRDEVINRIEQLAFELISAAADGQLPTLTCVSTAATNVHMAPRNSLATVNNPRATQQGLGLPGSTQGLGGEELEGSEEEEHDTEAAAAGEDGSGSSYQQQQQQQHVLRLGSKVQTKSLLANNGAQANSIVRALQLLDSVHALLKAGRTSTQRDIYYTLVGRAGFERPRDVTSAIQSVLAMLRVPRAALGISAASKGAVAGCLLLRPRPGEPWVDCRSVGPSGRPIPGEVGAVDAMTLRSAGARFILVVEKDAVFQSLVESRLTEQLPCIMVTGRGMPDVASRAFLAAVVEASTHWRPTAAPAAGSSGPANLAAHALSWQQQQPSLPVLGLVDWNPGGVSILLAYKYGCAALGLESARYAVPSLSWLGVTSDLLQAAAVPESRCHPLSARDKALLPNLKARLAATCPGWVQELDEMEGTGLKADIEAVDHDTLMRQLQQRVLQGRYLQ